MQGPASARPAPPGAEAIKPYVPHDVFNESLKAGLLGLGSGFFLAAARTAMSRRNVGAMSVFTQGAPIIGFITISPAAYVFFSRSMMNLREKEDGWAAAFGGFISGAILGLPLRRMPSILGMGAFVGAVQGSLFFLDQRRRSLDSEEDEFERKEILRRTTRVPWEETVAKIGEGKDIRPPGYEDRRRERLREKYGFEVNPVKATIDGSQ